MKLIGGCLVFLAIFGFSQEVTVQGILALLAGIGLMALPEIFAAIIHKARR